MRVRIAKLITVIVVVLNIIAVLFIWKLLLAHNQFKIGNVPYLINTTPTSSQPRLHQKSHDRLSHVQNIVTVIIRTFEHFENDVPDTVKSIVSAYNNITILIVSDNPLYPPIIVNSSQPSYRNVNFVHLKPTLINTFKDRNPLLQINGKYIFFIPDSTRFNSKRLIEKLVNTSGKNPHSILAVSYKNVIKSIKCLKIHLDVREWYIKFDELQKRTDCDLIKGKHAIFLKTQQLLNLSDPLMLPFPDAFYIQAASKGVKVIYNYI